MNKIVDNKSGKTDIHKGVDAIAVKSRIRHLIIPEQIINFTQIIFRELRNTFFRNLDFFENIERNGINSDKTLEVFASWLLL